MVKIVATSLQASLDEAVRRLEREARVAGGIHHPNVCAVSDFGKLDDGRPFLVMEHLTGESLATRLGRERSLPIAVAMDFAYQMLGGLDAAHRRGVIHRDIKPENLFLIEIGLGRHLLKVLDFGTAQVLDTSSPYGDELTDTDRVMGTMAYMSPEQLKGVRDFDARTDVYSAAVVIYEMLVGTRPFGDVPSDRLAEAIAFTRAPSILHRLPNLAHPVARAIDTALSVDRTRRPADAAAFLAMLAAPPSPTSIVDRSVPEADPLQIISDWDLPTHQNRAQDDWDLVTLERDRRALVASNEDVLSIDVKIDREPLR
ncbi:Serine/threonine protein kinase PrkC, regulator of stationary phase [Labilithrix luteola]|uniref:Serine/threonine protein kinase PrkC, regulator of stationary phase n=1 Tax=Labilithrix luteola TaxID=1391654 RepID=A0A0K1PYL9_9BACT|nr:Serine/threonine protein kinase PrkC, regulator of stationary phase [Labilithrix luteola]